MHALQHAFTLRYPKNIQEYFICLMESVKRTGGNSDQKETHFFKNLALI